MMDTEPSGDSGPSDLIFFENDKLHLVDQTILPARTVILELEKPEEVAAAINRLSVRGAMAIGVAAAYGVLLGASSAPGEDYDSAREEALKAVRVIADSRPTARNLFWALEIMEKAVVESAGMDRDGLLEQLRSAAGHVAELTVDTNRKLVEEGQQLVPDGCCALTHCNSGPLAAVRYGTALGILIEAHKRGKNIHVYVDETRPLLQGARLTTWELAREGVPYTLIPDNAAGFVMRKGLVDLVITGADRIAANGDAANKIGTYSLAVLARAHGIPFFIAAPFSTMDLEAATGDDIAIEQRDADEVRTFGGSPVAPSDAGVYNPAFDVTPAGYIEGIVTEHGVLRPPYAEALARVGNDPG